jgi:hypothetical protein
LQWRVFLGRPAVEQGLLTSTELRGPGWLRLVRGVYADSRLELDHELKCRAANLILPEAAMIAGPSAAVLQGVEFAATEADDAHVVVPRGARFGPVKGLKIHTAAVPAEPVRRQDMPCTPPARTAWDIANWRDLRTAVPIIDKLLQLGLVKPDELAVPVESAGVRGSKLAARAFELADGRSGSPQESRLRVRLILAGLPRPVCQFEVVLPSGRVLHPDLAWPEYQVAVEYDGGYHAEPGRLHTDRRRLNQLVTAGWIVLHVTSARMRNDFSGIIREVRTALRQRGAPLA